MMEFVRTERDEELLIITLARGKANALNDALVGELASVVHSAAETPDVRGIVLASDRPKFFSSGFDVAEVFAYDRDTMKDFFARFTALTDRLLRLQKPVIAAINGHTFAGGAVLAFACDRRVFAIGDYGFALNEINLGVAVTPSIIRTAVAAVGTTQARELILGGVTLNPEQALRIGLAHSLAAPDDLVAAAKARARELADKPPAAFAVVKRMFEETTGLPPSSEDRPALDMFIEQWFSPEAMARKQALVDSMQKRS
jgi:enoyl-CoA hydratase/carnithine racemase